MLGSRERLATDASSQAGGTRDRFASSNSQAGASRDRLASSQSQLVGSNSDGCRPDVQLPGLRRTPHASPEASPRCPFALDVEHLLHRYAKGVAQVLKPTGGEFGLASPSRGRHWSSDVRNTRSQDDAADAALTVLQQQQREEELKLGRACDNYRRALAEEHERWLHIEHAVTEASLATRQQELEVAKRHYTEPGRVRLNVAVQERQAAFALKIAQLQAADPSDNVTCVEADQEKKKKAYTNNAREWLLQDMRDEWRGYQRKIMDAVKSQLLQQGDAIAKVMGKHVGDWEEISILANSMWEKELQKTQHRLNILAQEYQAALRSSFAVELNELRKHAAEQARFFQNEIGEMQRVQQEEEELQAGQLRRMRLTLVKWRHDYLKDARRKAEEAAQHRWAGLKATVGNEHVSVETPAEDRPSPQDDGSADDYDAEPDDDGGSVSKHQSRRALIARPRAAAERLRNCRIVLEQIWERLPVSDDEIRAFQQRLESVVPCSGGVIHLYEEHVAEHGVVAALGTASSVTFSHVDGDSDSVSSEELLLKRAKGGRPLDPSWQPRSGAMPQRRLDTSSATSPRIKPGPGWR